MINSSYILIGDVNLNTYKNILFKYSYPSCMNINYNLSEEEKKNILTDELSFIKNKFVENKLQVNILQIPRILYDIFVILYIIKNEHLIYNYPVFNFDENLENYNIYCNFVDSLYTDEIINLMINIDKFIYDSITSNFKKIILNIVEWQKILMISINDIYTSLPLSIKNIMLKLINENDIEKYSSILDNEKILKLMESKSNVAIFQIRPITNSFKINPISKKIYEKIMIEIIQKSRTNSTINPKNEFLNYFQSINNLSNEDLLNFGKYIFNNSLIILIINYPFKKNLKLLNQILIDEIGFSINIKSNKFFIYRGSKDLTEDAIDITNPNRGYSVSYNMSILNGIINDDTSCTYIYMVTEENNNYSYKTRYVLTKHFYNINKSKDYPIDSELFFIPPLPPIIQLFSKGEMWHVRSKVGYDGIKEDIQRFAGNYNKENINKFPNYLISNFSLKEIQPKFKLFIKQSRKQIIDPEQKNILELFGGQIDYKNKYIKYKTKYLKIKKN